jgi:hypothetical protein
VEAEGTLGKYALMVKSTRAFLFSKKLELAMASWIALVPTMGISVVVVDMPPAVPIAPATGTILMRPKTCRTGPWPDADF